jgi:hypothetical protein
VSSPLSEPTPVFSHAVGRDKAIRLEVPCEMEGLMSGLVYDWAMTARIQVQMREV